MHKAICPILFPDIFYMVCIKKGKSFPKKFSMNIMHAVFNRSEHNFK